MAIDRIVMLFAGLMILASLALGVWLSAWFLLVTAFVGANLAQASLTGFCPLALILKRFGCQCGAAFH